MSWWQLKAILDENRAERRADQSREPVTCPIDGELLDVKGAVRNCPMGNYRWPAGAVHR